MRTKGGDRALADHSSIAVEEGRDGLQDRVLERGHGPDCRLEAPDDVGKELERIDEEFRGGGGLTRERA